MEISADSMAGKIFYYLETVSLNVIFDRSCDIEQIIARFYLIYAFI